MSMSNFLPGVTGMEPEITGAWPCVCGEAEECESIGTDCCDEQPQCQTITHRDPDGSINVITCRQGMGCDARDHSAEAAGY